MHIGQRGTYVFHPWLNIKAAAFGAESRAISSQYDGDIICSISVQVEKAPMNTSEGQHLPLNFAGLA